MKPTWSSRARIPLNTFAIAFGLVGLAGMWTEAAKELALPGIVAELFWLVATVAWVWLVIAHLFRGARSAETLGAQLKHPAQGPVAALVPVVGILLGNHLLDFSALVGSILIAAGIVVALVFAGWFLSFWVSGTVGVEAVHGGYLLPTVAAGYIAAIGLAKLGLMGPAIGAFGVASLWWVVVLTILLVRLAFRPRLPPPLVPTMMIMLAPPGLGTIAWFSINGLRADPIAEVLAVALVLMVAMQAGLLPRYAELAFSLGFWSFTFPIAAAGTATIEWMSIMRPAGWQAIDIAVVATVTVFIAGIGARSIREFALGRSRRLDVLTRQLTDADAVVEVRHPAL